MTNKQDIKDVCELIKSYKLNVILGKMREFFELTNQIDNKEIDIDEDNLDKVVALFAGSIIFPLSLYFLYNNKNRKLGNDETDKGIEAWFNDLEQIVNNVKNKKEISTKLFIPRALDLISIMMLRIINSTSADVNKGEMRVGGDGSIEFKYIYSMSATFCILSHGINNINTDHIIMITNSLNLYAKFILQTIDSMLERNQNVTH